MFALQDAARELRVQLNAHLDKNGYVSQLLLGLEPWLTLAETGRISHPVDSGNIPGAYLFTEQGLQEYNDLDKAYSHFIIQISGRGKMVEELKRRWEAD